MVVLRNVFVLDASRTSVQFAILGFHGQPNQTKVPQNQLADAGKCCRRQTIAYRTKIILNYLGLYVDLLFVHHLHFDQYPNGDSHVWHRQSDRIYSKFNFIVLIFIITANFHHFHLRFYRAFAVFAAWQTQFIYTQNLEFSKGPSTQNATPEFEAPFFLCNTLIISIELLTCYVSDYKNKL